MIVSYFENQIVTEQEMCCHVANRENTNALSVITTTLAPFSVEKKYARYFIYLYKIDQRAHSRYLYYG